MDSYFVVGPNVYLSGNSNPETQPYPELEIYSSGQHSLGRLTSSEKEDGLHLQLTANDLDFPTQLEALRLYARIVTRLSSYSLPLHIDNINTDTNSIEGLIQDGFTPNERGYERPGGKFTRHTSEKANGMDEVYDDPFTIPWNFVPIEMDVLKHLLKYTSPPNGNRVFELGCGYGKNAQYLSDLGYDVWGIDISSKAIERCKSILKKPEQYFTASATSIPLPDNYLTAILDVGCLHCIPRQYRPKAVTEISRVLAPGGIVFSRMFKSRPQKWIDEQPFKTTEFGITQEEALQLFNMAGLKYESLQEHNDMNYWKLTKDD